MSTETQQVQTCAAQKEDTKEFCSKPNGHDGPHSFEEKAPEPEKQ